MTFKKGKWLIATMCIFLFIVAGCSTKKSRPSPPQWTPTCADAISGSLDRLSENDIENMLDEALQKKRMEECWKPLMKLCLDQNKEIPHAHLAQAVNEFNSLNNKSYFQKAVFRYFSDIDKGIASYRDEDKELLTAYCRYVVRNAQSSQDPAVKTAELLTRRLDPDLFDLMFR